MDGPWPDEGEYLRRLRAAAKRYQQAVQRVDEAIAAEHWNSDPPLAYALERLPKDELDALGSDIAAAERSRRMARVALHASTEAYALRPEVDQETAETSEMSRFVSVVEYAWAGGCSYVNGEFLPRTIDTPTTLVDTRKRVPLERGTPVPQPVRPEETTGRRSPKKDVER